MKTKRQAKILELIKSLLIKKRDFIHPSRFRAVSIIIYRVEQISYIVYDNTFYI